MDNRQFIPPPPINTQCSKCSDRVCRLRFVESSTIPHERVLLSKSSIATTMLPSIALDRGEKKAVRQSNLWGCYFVIDQLGIVKVKT